MYCTKCGKYNADDKVVCMYCGHHMKDIPQENKTQENKQSFYESPAWQNSQRRQDQNGYQYAGEEKGGIGIVLGFFFGLLGLLIGLLLYPAFTYERETFINGWIKGLIIGVIITVVLMFAIVCTGGCVGLYY